MNYHDWNFISCWCRPIKPQRELRCLMMQINSNLQQFILQYSPLVCICSVSRYAEQPLQYIFKPARVLVVKQRKPDDANTLNIYDRQQNYSARWKFHNSILYSLHTRLQTVTAIETTQNLSASAPTFQSAGKIPPWAHATTSSPFS